MIFKRPSIADSIVEEKLARSIFAIPSYNGGNLLQRMLPTTKLPPHIVHVLDQTSNDNTAEVCAQYGAKLVQLGERRTYTQCCNIALQIANENKSEFLFISNNDITFVTDVARELLAEMIQDPSLGILSCSQVITDSDRTNPILSNRVEWDLSQVSFDHDTSILAHDYYRLESDFCELTLAVVRVSALKEIGGFDNDYGFYHEDADVGFRLREAGYATAYLPRSQIEHFQGSTFNKGLSDERSRYIERSKSLFYKKHCGYGLNYPSIDSDIPSSWTIINRNLFPNLKKIGMIDGTRPSLTFAHPGYKPFDYLYSVWETSRLPTEWAMYQDAYRCVFLPSYWNLEAFFDSGFRNCHYVPLGVNTDVFHPWANGTRFFDEPTYLWFARNQYRKGLDIMLLAWAEFRSKMTRARLVVLGHGVLTESSIPRGRMLRTGNYLIWDDVVNGIYYVEIIKPLSEEQVAAIYRGVDCVVATSRSEGFGFNVVEALSCGTMVVFPGYGGTKDMLFKGALAFDGAVHPADYADKGFRDVGNWWEPRPSEISHLMLQVLEMSESDREILIRAATNMVRSKFTWRNTVFSIREAVKLSQIRRLENRQKDLTSNSLLPEAWLLESFAKSDSPPVSLSDLLDKDLTEIFEGFDPKSYLVQNQDLAQYEVEGLWHFVSNGWAENRKVEKDLTSREYLIPRVEARSYLMLLNGVGLSAPNREVATHFFKWLDKVVNQLSANLEVSNFQLIQSLYHMLLARAPDHGGLQHYIEKLATGSLDRLQIVEAIRESKESRDIRSVKGVLPEAIPKTGQRSKWKLRP